MNHKYILSKQTLCCPYNKRTSPLEYLHCTLNLFQLNKWDNQNTSSNSRRWQQFVIFFKKFCSSTKTICWDSTLIYGFIQVCSFGKSIFFLKVTHIRHFVVCQYIFDVQLPSCVWLFASPWTVACHASLSLHHLSEFAQVHIHWIGDAIQPSHPCGPLFLLPSIFCGIRGFSNELAVFLHQQVDSLLLGLQGSSPCVTSWPFIYSFVKWWLWSSKQKFK